MQTIRQGLKTLADRHRLNFIYAIGSNAEAAYHITVGGKDHLTAGSDLDLAVKTATPLDFATLIDLQTACEDLFDHRIDLIDLANAPAYLALEAVTGWLLYTSDPVAEAEYQLYVMRVAADLLPFKREAEDLILRRRCG